MTREQAEAQLGEMGAWLQSMPGASGKFDISLVPGMTAAPGVTGDEIAGWEGEHGVPLPQVLRDALSRQNGGFVRDSEFRVLPLSEIERPDDEFWEWASYEEQDVPDRSLLFRFAEDEFGGTYLFCCPAGAQDQPSVFSHYHDSGGDLNRCSKSITRFFERMLATSETPAVDWSETENLEVIARERIDLSPIHGGPAEKEQVLARHGETIVLFVHERSPAREQYARTALPEPLSRHLAMLQPCRPAPIVTYSLVLQPENIEAIESVESERTSDGQWKNSSSRGTPICVLFESADRGRLEALRRALFGKQAADCAQAQEDQQQKFQQALAGLSLEQRQAAMAQAMLRMREQFAQLQGGPLNPEQRPPEAAGLHDLMQQKFREIEQRAKDVLGKHPVGPDVLRMFGELNPEIARLFKKSEEPGPA